MKKGRRSARSSLLGRIGLLFLGSVALAAILAAGVQFMNLLDADREMDAVVREDAMWAVFQTDRHIRQLHAQAMMITETGNPGYHPRLMRDFDILYSRARLLERGTFRLNLSNDGTLSQHAHEIAAYVVDLAEVMDALQPDDAAYIDRVARLASELDEWRARANQLLLQANAETNQMRVSDRSLRSKTQDNLGWLALVLVGACIGIFLLLTLQVRQLGHAYRRMELQEERSRRHAQRAKAANRAKSVFLATMSHEIRTPLNGIIGSAELLALQALPGDANARLDTISAQAFLLRDLIDGILDFSRLEAGLIDTARSETDLGVLERLLASAFAEQAQGSGLELSIDLPKRHVMVHDARLRQVLVNLIGNGLKFTHSGGVRVRGQILEDGLLRVEVEDDGIGIAPEHVPKLFKDFSQIDNGHARNYEGTGLGLAICRRIVEGLGGRIDVESTPGHGSLFWFELPVDPLPGKDAASLQAQPNDPPATVSGLDILVAEDNPVNLDVITGLLHHLGHRVHVARTGRKAVDLLPSLAPDLVLMDMQMPEMDGLEATRRIRAFDRDIRIIGVTANAFEEDRQACLRAGMNDFLSKPVTASALDTVIRRLHAGRAAPQDPEPSPREQSPPSTAGPEDHATAPNAQLNDLAAAMGAEVVLKLIDRFEADLASHRQSLLSAGDAQEANTPEVQDGILHNLKGAALTLGLSQTGQEAQRLRGQLPVTAAQIDRLLTLAREDLLNARQGLMALAE